MNFKQQLKKYSHIKPNYIKSTNEIIIKPFSMKPIPANITIQYNQTIFMQNSNQSNEDISKFFTATFFNDSNCPSLRESNNYDHHSPLQPPAIHKNPFVNKKKKLKRSPSIINITKSKENNCKPLLNTDSHSRNQGEESTFNPKSTSIASSISSTTMNRSNSTKMIHSKSNKASMLSNTNGIDKDIILFILCINCGNNIYFDDIERHSRKCTKVTEDVIKNDTCKSNLTSINYKLKKLKEHLEKISENKAQLPKEYEHEMKYISTIVFHYIEEAIKLDNVSLLTIKSIKEILKNLDALGLTHRALSSLVLIDRSRVLIKEKVIILRESLKKKGKIRISAMENRIKSKLKDIEEIKLNTELEKIKVKTLRKNSMPNLSSAQESNFVGNTNDNSGNIKNNSGHDIIIQDEICDHSIININNKNNSFNNIEDIVSDIDNSQLNNDISFTSIKSDITFDDCKSFNNQNNISTLLSNKNQLHEEESVIFDKNKEKRERREFFKELLRIKFEKLHSTHSGLRIPQQLVWDECKSNNITKEKWKEFILGELNMPEKYENIIAGKRKGSKFKKEMLTIIEEEKN